MNVMTYLALAASIGAKRLTDEGLQPPPGWANLVEGLAMSARAAQVPAGGGQERTPWHDAEMLTYDQVAVECGVSTRTVRRWVADGQLPSVTLGARSRRIRRSDLEDFIDTRSPQ